MKKYTPSVKNNNAVKEELCSEMKGLLYALKKENMTAVSTVTVCGMSTIH